MKIVEFEDAVKNEITLFDAHAHHCRVNQCCISEMYRFQPRSHSGLIYVADGSHIFVDSDGNQIKVNANEMLYAPQGSNYYHSPCIGEKDEDGTVIDHTSVYVVDFKLVLDNEPVVLSDKLVRMDSNLNKMIGRKFVNMVDGYNSAMPSYFRFQEQLFDVLSDICEDYSHKRLSRSKYELIKPAIEYLASNNIADVDVSELADLCYISNNYFRKLFCEYYGCLPHQYLNSLKMKRAIYLLETGDYSISDVSAMLGFATPSYFSSCFKKHYGYLPSQHKR